MIADEMDLGSRDKSPEVVELTPALEIEGGRRFDVSENNDEIVVSKAPPNSEMSETEKENSGLERSDSQGEKSSNLELQTLMNLMQQLCQQQKQSEERARAESEKIVQELKENQKQMQELKEGQVRVILECQRLMENLCCARKILVILGKLE
jgi:uncharacterized protein with WD repeat